MAVSYLPKNQETEAEAVPKLHAADTEAEIFTPEKMRKLLTAAGAELIPFLALGAFAGFRTAEIGRLDWSSVDFEWSIITIRADQAKTASRRIVPMSENLAALHKPQPAHPGIPCTNTTTKKPKPEEEKVPVPKPVPTQHSPQDTGIMKTKPKPRRKATPKLPPEDEIPI